MLTDVLSSTSTKKVATYTRTLLIALPIWVALLTRMPPSWWISLSKENSSKYPGAADEARTAAHTGYLHDPLKLEWTR